MTAQEFENVIRTRRKREEKIAVTIRLIWNWFLICSIFNAIAYLIESMSYLELVKTLFSSEGIVFATIFILIEAFRIKRIAYKNSGADSEI